MSDLRLQYLVPAALGLLIAVLDRKQYPHSLLLLPYVLSMPMSWLVQQSQFFVPLGLLLNFIYLYVAVVRVYHLSRMRAAFRAILLGIWTTLLEFLVIVAAFAAPLMGSVQS